MKDVTGLLQLAFKLAHEVSDASLDLDRAPGLRDRPFFSCQIADSGVSALAQVAAASEIFPKADYRSRMDAATALRGAREDLRRLRDCLECVLAHGYVERGVPELIKQVDELSIILTALTVEVRGNPLAA